MKRDATPDAASGTDWYTIGPGEEQFSKLNQQAPAGDGFEFLQLRISIFLPTSITPLDSGGIIDDWTIHLTHDQ